MIGADAIGDSIRRGGGSRRSGRGANALATDALRKGIRPPRRLRQRDEPSLTSNLQMRRKIRQLFGHGNVHRAPLGGDRCAFQARARAADEQGRACRNHGPNAENYRQSAHARSPDVEDRDGCGVVPASASMLCSLRLPAGFRLDEKKPNSTLIQVMCSAPVCSPRPLFDTLLVSWHSSNALICVST